MKATDTKMTVNEIEENIKAWFHTAICEIYQYGYTEADFEIDHDNELNINVVIRGGYGESFEIGEITVYDAMGETVNNGIAAAIDREYIEEYMNS